MIRPNLERRVAMLEEQMAELRAAGAGQTKDWRRAVAKYADDADLQSIFAAAMKLRDADRKQSKKRPGRGKSQ